MADIRQNIWDKLVEPEISKVRSDYNKQIEDIKRQIEESKVKAQQEARAYAEQNITDTIRSIQNANRTNISIYENNARQIQDLLAGKTQRISLSYPGYGAESWKAGDLSDQDLNSMLAGNQRYIQELTDPNALRQQAVQKIIERDPQNIFGGDYKYASLVSMGSFFPERPEDFQKIEDRLKEEIYLTSLPQAESYYVDPLNNQVEMITRQFDEQINNLSTAGNETELRERQKLYDYMQKRNDDMASEIKLLQDKGEYTPQLGEAIRMARDAEMNFLAGSEFGFTPQAYTQARQVYDQARQQNIQALQQPAQAVTPPVAQQPVTAPLAQQPAQPVTPPLAAVQQPVTPPLAQVQQPVTTPLTQVQQPVTPPLTQQPTTQQPTVTAQPIAAGVPPSQSFLGGIPVGISQAQPPTGTTMATTPSLNPATLPELRSAGGGGTSAIDPTLRPYLELGLRAAEQQFLQNVPQFFPGQTYVSPSQQTLDALAAQEQIARQAPTTLQAAQESYMRGLGGLGATASGAFLMGNPYQQQMIQAATRPIMQQFEEQTLPGIASGFSQAGRYGSGAMERALGRATESTARAIGDVGTNIAFQDYGAERGRQQQAILGQITAAGQAPAIYGQQFLPSQQLAQIGAAQEAIAGLPLQEQMQRFSFAQQAPRESLNAFLSSVYGTPMARSQYAPTPEAQTNRVGNVFGGLATGAGIGYMLGGTTGAGYGAALGGLGGLLA